MRGTLRLTALPLIALLGLILCQCDDQVAGGDALTLCESDMDCPDSQMCQDGVCVPTIACDGDTPCPVGLVCVDGFCQTEQADGGDGDDGDDGGDGEDGGDEGESGPDIAVVFPALSEGIYQINFGNAAVGVVVQQQVVLSNEGDEDLHILNLNFESGTDLDDFSLEQSLLDSLPLIIEPGQETTIDVIYLATDGITDHSILDIISNDMDESLVQIHLLSEFKGEPEIALSKELLEFGDVPVAQTGLPLSFTISNQGTGNAVLTVEDIRFGVLSNEDFTMEILDIEQNAVVLPTLLNNGDSLDVNVLYHPQQAEYDEDKVVVVSDDPLNPSLDVIISGTGVVGSIAVDPSPLDLGRVRVGQHGEALTTITNSGGAAVELSGIVLDGTSAAWSLSSSDLSLDDLATSPHPLGPGESAAVLLGFDPQDVAQESGSMLVDHSGPGGQLAVALSAEGYIAPAATLDPTLLEFLDVQFDAGTQTAEVRSLTVTIGNVGGEPLLISAAELDSASTEFAWDTPPPSINPEEEATLQVTFTPESSGVRSNFLLLDTNDPDQLFDGVEGRLALELSAQAIDPALIVNPAGPHNYGDLAIGASDSLTVIMISGTPDPLWVHDIQLATGNQADFSLGTLPDISQPMTTAGSSLSFDINYHPSGVGTHYATVTITSSDIGNNPVTIELSGMSSGCPEGWSNCDSDPDCETPITTIDNCGGCDIQCTNDHGGTNCVSQLCDPNCDAGYESCDGEPNDGCETHLDTSLTDCGGCNRQCIALNVDALACVDGTCSSTCQSGYGNCVQPAAPADDDGCETDLNSAVNCGDCDRACDGSNTDTLSCSGGLCVSSCLDGYGNCVQPAAPALDDGCETQIDQDTSACGDCDRACSLANVGTLSCTGGVCVSTCQLGFGNCIQPAAPAADDGCETLLNSDVANCGYCSRPCAAANTSALNCTGGLCSSSCQNGYANCVQPAAPLMDDGCETYVDGETANCGDCGRACSSFNVATLACAGGVCTSSCNGSYGNCIQPTAPGVDDGCETDLDFAANHCGACGRSCSTSNVNAAQCAGGVCTSTCLTGWANCTQPGAGQSDDGCETQLGSDANCSACGDNCDDGRFPQADGVCNNGTCEMGDCYTDWWDLDSSGDSCEYNCVRQGSADLPDSGMVDANCDGIDGVIGDAIFVSADNGSDTWPGTMAQPVQSIAVGLTKTGSYLLVASGDYSSSSTINLVNGKSIYGGYDDSDWSRDVVNLTRVLVSASIAIRADGISLATYLTHLVIEGGNSGSPAGSAYGILATSSNGLRVQLSSVRAGSGGNGSNGWSPSGVAASGGNGNAGSPGCEDSNIFCSSCTRPYGGTGGTSACSRTGGTGGRPGHEYGDGDNGGAGAGGTSGGQGTPDSQGNWNTPITYAGRNGANGANGNDGAAGSPAFASSGFSPNNGAGGLGGSHGNGGGGGGGGGGGHETCDSYGGSGAGGGAGGCGGTAANGGTSAGGSFAVYLWNSNVTIENCELITVGGGAGGSGGTGQPGGSGGAYGWGGDPSRPNSGNPYNVSGEQGDGSNGGRGGNGGDGGRGGHGGGGAGGPSIGVFEGGTSSANISNNDYTIGAAGAGGSSSGNSGPIGISAQVY